MSFDSHLGDLRSAAHFDDLTLKNIESLPNQRIVFELFLIKGWRRGGFGPRCGGTRGRSGSRSLCWRRGRGSLHRRPLGGGHGRRCRPRTFGRIRLNEFDVQPRVTQFPKLVLQQRLVARVVHQRDVIRKLRGEPDGQNAVREGYRMRFEQVRSSEGTRTTHGFKQFNPKFVESRGWRRFREDVFSARFGGGRFGAGSVRGRLGWCRWTDLVDRRNRRGSRARQCAGLNRCGRSGRRLRWRLRRARASSGTDLLQFTQDGIQADGIARFDGLEQRHFQQNLL